MRHREAGFSLIEMLVVCGLIAVFATGAVAFTLSSQPYELAGTLQQFDAVLGAARSTASAYGDGATIYVRSAPGGHGFVAQVYAHRPGNPASAAAGGIPVLNAKADVEETTSLHKPSFAVVVHGSGAVGGRAGYAAGDAVTGAETACPSTGAFVFVFTVNGHSATRNLPCKIDLALTGGVLTARTPTPGAGPTAAPGTCATVGACAGTPPSAASALPTCPPTNGTLEPGNACNYPLVVSPLELYFVNSNDTNPMVYDGNGNFLGTTDPGGNVHVSEQFFNASYSVNDTACQGLITPLPAKVQDVGFGGALAMQGTKDLSSLGQCRVTIADGAGQTTAIGVHVAGPLVVLDDASQIATSSVEIHSTAIGGWQTISLDAAKLNFSLPIQPSLDLGSCAPYVSATTTASTQLVNGSSEARLTLTGIAPTFNAATLQRFSCQLTVLDQYASIAGETATLSVFVDPHPAPVQPSAPCSVDSIGHCVASTDSSALNPVVCFTQPEPPQRSAKVPEAIGNVIVNVYSTDGSITPFTQQIVDDGTGNCTTMSNWSPAEPSIFFNDQNLP